VRALVDVDVEPGLEQGQRGCETADAASDDADRDLPSSDGRKSYRSLAAGATFRLSAVL